MTQLLQPNHPQETEIIEIIPSVWQKKSPVPGPTITILGGEHGDETAGVKIAEDLLAYMHAHPIQCGTLNIGIGNPAAVAAQKRFIEKDLNRCFGPNSVEATLEEKRAQLLKTILCDTDVFISLHSTIKPSKPMLCVPNLAHPQADILKMLGIPTVITGKGLLPPDGTPIYSDTYVCAHGGPHDAEHGGFAVTVESGHQVDTTIVPKLRAHVLQLLIALGIFDKKNSQSDQKDLQKIEMWDAYRNIIAGMHGFVWAQEFGNFDRLPPHTHFATSDGIPLITGNEESIILFPKPQARIVPGQEACILAKPWKAS